MSRDPTTPSLAHAIARGAVAAALAAALAALGSPLFVVAVPIGLGVILVCASVAVAVDDAWPGRRTPLDRPAAGPPAPPGAGDDRPTDLVQIERALAVSGTAGGFHFQARPIFVRLAASVANRLSSESPLVQAVHPDRPAPDDRLAPGASLDQLAVMVDELEVAWTRR